MNLSGMDTGARRYYFEQYLNVCAFQNGKNLPRVYDRSAWYKLSIQDYPFVPIATPSSTGNLVGAYSYFVVAVNSRQRNRQGQVKCGLPSIPVDVDTAGQIVTLTAIPSTHPDSQVDFWFIYRCKADTKDADTTTSDLDYFYVGRVAVGTTQFVDNVPDDELDDAERLRENCNILPCGKYLSCFADRFFTGGFDPIETGTVSKAEKTISDISKAAQVVTVTASSHGYSAGEWVSIGLTTPDLRFDGCVYIRSVPNGNQFTYHREGADVAALGSGGIAQKISFSGVTLPDGVQGAIFQKQGEGTVYRILGYNSTTGLALDRPFSGTLSGASFRIFRNPWEIYYTEYGDVFAAGFDGEQSRNILQIPGKEELRGLIPWNGQQMVFTAQNIYAISGKGPNSETDVRITPDPAYAGYGAVGGDAVWTEGEELYFVTTQGLYVLRPGRGPEPVGERLGTDWLDSLDASEQELICLYSNGKKLWVNYPESGNSQNSKAFRYERTLDQWYPEEGPFAKFGFRYDGDGGIQGQAFYVVGRDVWQPDYGAIDGPAGYSGVLTGATSLSATNSGASFATSGGGLENVLARFYRTAANGVETLLGTRLITSNSGTSVSWAASGAGGGTLALQAGDRYEIGNIPWSWKTKDFEQSGHETKVRRLVVGVRTKGSSTYVRMQKYVNGAAVANNEKLELKKLTEAWDVADSADTYAVVLSSREGAVLRTATVMGMAKAKNQ